MLVWKFIFIFFQGVHTHTCTGRGQRSEINLECCSSKLLFGGGGGGVSTGSLTETQDSSTMLDLLTNEPQGSACLCFPNMSAFTFPPLGLQVYITMPHFLQGSWRWGSGPHAFTSTLPSCLPILPLPSLTNGKTVYMPKTYSKINFFVIYHQQICLIGMIAYFM